ncbi:DUF354 domain-containing protein [Natrinema versiforme]|uniref:DUF354 domain-containing protein n=1 Tax=Natrinema versiforme TaxID=88724 RepID=A0A4P8WFW4_9EURY|nr:DUF354 domain-containing protein [Natrinema versiforme]QCS41954.1 DUF354 domain-containing protein [Natrinema versiforme]
MSETAERVVSTIQHPAHVHFFRNAIGELEDRGYDVHVFAREKDLVRDLLEAYDIEYRTLAAEPGNLYELAKVQAKYEYEVIRRTRELEPAALMAIAEPSITHASRVSGGRSVLFTDTEHATVQNLLAFPFSDVICTPDSFRDDLGSNHVRYSGYHELAYLHPDRFSPDPTVLDRIGADADETLVVLRLVSWTAAHDVGKDGLQEVEPLVERLEAAGCRVVISAEAALPPSLADREVSVPPHRIHDLLSHADLLIGESGTMTIESALLGTPAMFVSPFSAGVLTELEDRYGLVFSRSETETPADLSRLATTIVAADPAIWQRRRRALLEEKIDTTAFIVHAVEQVIDA